MSSYNQDSTQQKHNQSKANSSNTNSNSRIIYERSKLENSAEGRCSRKLRSLDYIALQQRRNHEKRS